MHQPPKDNFSQSNRDIANTGLVIAGRNFNCSFGFPSISASLGFGMVLDGVAGASTKPSVFNAVLGLGFGDFSFGFPQVSYDDSGTNDGSGLNAGVSYSTGPWGVSLGYATVNVTALPPPKFFPTTPNRIHSSFRPSTRLAWA